MVLKDLTKELDSVVFDKKIDTGKLLLTKALLSFFLFLFCFQVWKSNCRLWNEYWCDCNRANSITNGGSRVSHSSSCWFCLQTASSLSIHGRWHLDLLGTSLAECSEVRKIVLAKTWHFRFKFPTPEAQAMVKCLWVAEC